MSKNKITFEDVMDIVDNHIEKKRNIMFVCDKELAGFIQTLMEDYDVYDYEYACDKNVEEYYVSISFYNNAVNLIVENARGISGKYKYDESDFCDYLIGTNMSKAEAREFLVGKCNTCSWFEIEDNDYEIECDCEECCGCCDGEDDTETLEDILIEYVEKIMEVSPCPNCIYEKLGQFADKIVGRFLN